MLLHHTKKIFFSFLKSVAENGPSVPIVVDTSFDKTTTQGTSLAVSPPPLIANSQLWVVLFCTDAAETVSAPPSEGWTKGATTNPGASENPTATLFYKTAGVAEGDATFSWGSLEHAVAYSIAISGGVYDDSTVNNISTNGTDIDSPGIIVGEDNSLVFEFGIGDDNSPSTATWNTVPSGTDIGENLIRSGPETGGVYTEGVYNEQDSGAAPVGSWVSSDTRPRSTISLSVNPI